MGRVWTIEQRQKQADRIRSQKPWLKSTGPRSARGKLASSRNAMRHGCYGAEFKMICQYLRMQKHYVDTLRFMLKADLFMDETQFEISGNELNENSIKSIKNDTMRHSKTVTKNIISKNKIFNLSSVIPAKAGIQRTSIQKAGWIEKNQNDNNKKPAILGGFLENFMKQSKVTIQKQLRQPFS